MKIVIQRVKRANVKVANEIIGQIDQGLLLLVGLARGDTAQQMEWLARKVVALRIFERDGLMNQSVRDIGGDILSVSQFTLLADCSRGNRPGFSGAMLPDEAREMFDSFNQLLSNELGRSIETGQFGAAMEVSLVNDGPVTIVLER